MVSLPCHTFTARTVSWRREIRIARIAAMALMVSRAMVIDLEGLVVELKISLST